MKSAHEWVREFASRNEGPKNAPCLSVEDLRLIQADVWKSAADMLSGYILTDVPAFRRMAQILEERAKKVSLPLIRSRNPGSVNLTKSQIEEHLL